MGAKHKLSYKVTVGAGRRFSAQYVMSKHIGSKHRSLAKAMKVIAELNRPLPLPSWNIQLWLCLGPNVLWEIDLEQPK